MALKRIYQNWGKDLDSWRDKLRHLKWISEYRINLIKPHIELKNKKVLDIGSGPQFSSDLLKSLGAEVITLDKYAPCQVCLDVNQDFSKYFEKNEFDLILMGAVIRYIKNKSLFFKRLSGILRKDGIVFIDEFVHNFYNDVFLEVMVQLGAMEQWPKENFTPVDELEKIILQNGSFKINRIYSCWPHFALEGKYPYPVWYSLLLKKNKPE